MSEKADRLAESLEVFGLSRVEAAVYLALRVQGEMTALKLSRQLKLARTRVYRVLNRLLELGLVMQKLGGRGYKFVASDTAGFELLVKKRELELVRMRQAVAVVDELVLQLTDGEERKKSEIRYFTGVEGLKQVTWNSVKAEELLIIEMEDMSALMDYSFAEKVRQEFVKRQVKIRELTNQRRLAGWTKVAELVAKHWQCRYISPKQLKVEYEMLIYNSVVVMYTLRQDEPFILEIHNPHVAAMQRQLFEFVWSQAERMRVINEEGAAEVV